MKGILSISLLAIFSYGCATPKYEGPSTYQLALNGAFSDLKSKPSRGVASVSDTATKMGVNFKKLKNFKVLVFPKLRNDNHKKGPSREEIEKLDGEIVYALLHRRRLEQQQLEGKRAQGFLMLKNIDEEFNQRKVTPENT